MLYTFTYRSARIALIRSTGTTRRIWINSRDFYLSSQMYLSMDYIDAFLAELQSLPTNSTLFISLKSYYAQYHSYAISYFSRDLKFLLPNLLVVLAAAYLLRVFYGFIFTPYKHIVNTQMPVELEKIDCWRKDVTGVSVAAINRLRKTVGKIPPPYPRYGWFILGLSSALSRPGSTLRVNALGKNIIVFRGISNPKKIFGLDAFCPHLGADLGGGSVEIVKTGNKGEVYDCIECPFHGWKFSGEDGVCKNIPYDNHIPKGAIVKKYIVIESSGFIMLWNDTENDPKWYPLQFPDIDSGSYRYHGHSEHFITTHIQEIPENGADIMHLSHLHLPFIGPIINTWDAEWKPNPTEQHLSSIRVQQRMAFSLFGHVFHLPFPTTTTKVQQNGPGFTFHEFDMMFGLWKIVIIGSQTPLAPILQRSFIIAYANWLTPRWFVKLMLAAFVDQFERDVPIWNNKRFEHHPLLAGKKEASVLKYRRWFKQFYDEKEFEESQAAAGTSAFLKENGVDW